MAFKGFVIYAIAIGLGLTLMLASGWQVPIPRSDSWASSGGSGYRGSGGSFGFGGGK